MQGKRNLNTPTPLENSFFLGGGDLFFSHFPNTLCDVPWRNWPTKNPGLFEMPKYTPPPPRSKNVRENPVFHRISSGHHPFWSGEGWTLPSGYLQENLLCDYSKCDRRRGIRAPRWHKITTHPLSHVPRLVWEGVQMVGNPLPPFFPSYDKDGSGRRGGPRPPSPLHTSLHVPSC